MKNTVTDGSAQSFSAPECSEPLEEHGLRSTLGCFATGVTIVTTRGQGGRRIGVTVNSFSSVSLNPPLVLWSLSRKSPNLEEFCRAGYFAVNVLADDQYDLSLRFSTPLRDKFEGVEYVEGAGGVPLVRGAIAQFVCRNFRQYDGGDHMIFIGEIKQYNRFDGRPLVFHSGRYYCGKSYTEVNVATEVQRTYPEGARARRGKAASVAAK